MSEWTEGAKREWQKYCEQIRERLRDTGADASEVIDDMRVHIETELSSHGSNVITEHDVRHIVNRMGLPEEEQAQSCSAKQNNLSSDARKKDKPVLSLVFIFLFGIILPIVAVFVELVTGICAEAFFDPLPTVWHILLFLLIPLSNLSTFIIARKDSIKYFGFYGLLNSAAIGVAVIYTLLFLPLLPISVFAILAMGLGFCGLAPLFSLIFTIRSRSLLRRLIPESRPKRVPYFWTGLVVSVLAMILAILPSVLTRIGIQMAVSESRETQARGVKLLRTYGDDTVLLEGCYRRFGLMTDLVTALFAAQDPPTPQQIRNIYYRVTGRSFNSVPPPVTSYLGRSRLGAFDFDLDEGEARVGSRLAGLSLISSRIDGSVDADGVLGYLEWTMVFKNDHRWDRREARAQVQLPPGGVVSRLTLWIDGEPREAAFAKRSKTREAYKSVVRRRKDPVLVTTNGPDRVLVQCFPVPPDGGEMKIRVGITFPLQLTEDNSAVLRLPYFNERNFNIPADTEHSIWIEAKQAFLHTKLSSMTTENPKTEFYALRGEASDKMLLDDGVITFSRDSNLRQVWTNDTVYEHQVILQAIEKTQASVPNHIVFVIDTSEAMKPFMEEIAKAIEYLPSGVKTSIVTVRDFSEETVSLSTASARETREKISTIVTDIVTEGGVDNIPALEKAWDIASTDTNSLIVWINSGQPVLFEPVENLRQKWERRPGGPDLIQIQTVAGVNKIIEGLDGFTQVGSLPRLGTVYDDMKRLFYIWDGKLPRYVLVRSKAQQALAPTDSTKKTSEHLARLWAKEAVEELCRAKPENYLHKATIISTDYQLVTPVSGAVVLESEQQYVSAGLEPADPATVPTIPEPETWAMLIIVALIIGWLIRKRQPALRLA